MAVIGGHSVRDAEIKFGMAVTGLIHPQRILTNASARPGDKLVLTKPLGTGFITTAHRAEACPDEVFQAACASMIQLNDVARDAMLAAGAHAATDITGFGLAGHAFEMAEGSGVTLVIEVSRLPLLPGVDKLAHRPFLTRASIPMRPSWPRAFAWRDIPIRSAWSVFTTPRLPGACLSVFLLRKRDLWWRTFGRVGSRLLVWLVRFSNVAAQ